MKKAIMLVLTALFLVTGLLVWAEDAPPEVIAYVEKELAKIGTDPIVVAAVKAENAKGKSLGSIQDLDAEWKGTAGIVDYMTAMMESPCGQHLRSFQDTWSFIAEIFVMDNQGANVAMTDKTSDYWQGDEAKFKESYNNGMGAVFVDEVEFDDSTQAYLVQASFPVKDGTKVIGAVTVGIDIDIFEEQN